MGTTPTGMRFFADQFKPGSVVLINGASSGVGREIAYRYAARGCPIVISGRNKVALDEVVAKCKSEFGNQDVHAFVADANNEEQNKQLVEFTVQKFNRINILVLAAGVSAHSRFEDLPNMDIFKEVIETNLYGYVYPTRYALPHLLKQHGQIVVVSSTSGVLPLPLRTHYSASKAAVNAFFNALKWEHENTLSITIALPPTIKGTNFRNSALTGAVKAVDDQSQSALGLQYVVDVIMRGSDKRFEILFMPESLWMINKIYPFMPWAFNPLIRRAGKL